MNEKLFNISVDGVYIDDEGDIRCSLRKGLHDFFCMFRFDKDEEELNIRPLYDTFEYFNPELGDHEYELLQNCLDEEEEAFILTLLEVYLKKGGVV